MEMIKRYIYIITFCIGFCESNFLEYDIKIYGIKAAKCKVIISDTLFNGIDCIKAEYKVNSTKTMDLFFNVNNSYITVFDKYDYSIKFFKKYTVQPNLVNDIITNLKNSDVYYSDSDYKILSDEYNIFTLLHKIASENFIDVNKKIILDREGKKYFGEIIQKNEYVELFTEEININDKGLIEHTDIFSWALYLPQTSKTIYVDKKSNAIQSCRFRKGFLVFIAELVN